MYSTANIRRWTADQKTEEAGTKAFPPLFAPFGFDLCGLLV
jgi:hypothetical protein